MRKAESALDLIGNTPMIRINKLADPNGAQLWVKMEHMNPGHSVKDRIALRIVEDYEKDGTLQPGGTIVEATSGNTGMGLAIVCAIKGYGAIFIMPDKVSDEKRRLLRAMGSEVIMCPTAVAADHPDSYYSVAERITRETAGAVLANQYYNPSNTQTHYDTTGPEIWEQTEGKIDVFVGSMGTGGTITGISKFLKEKNPEIKVWAADPFGSILKAYKDTGKITTGHTYLVEGIGEDIVPGNLDIDLVDEVVNINDEDSFYWSRQLARKEGIMAGGSAGTIIKVAVAVAADMRPDQLVVSMIPDTGERYLSKHFSDEWLQEKGMMRREMVTLRRLIQLKGDQLSAVISVGPEEPVRTALSIMRDNNISQLPVLRNEKNLGSVRESSLLAGVLDDSSFMDRPVSDAMESAYPTIHETDTVTTCIPLLRKHQAVLVTKDEMIVGFITRHDVINFSEGQ